MLNVNHVHCFVTKGPKLVRVSQSWVNNIGIIKLVCYINYHDQFHLEIWINFNGNSHNWTFQKSIRIWNMCRTLSHIIHIIIKNILCEAITSFSSLGLAHFELIIYNNLFKALQWYHSNTLDPKKLMYQWCPDMVQFSAPTLP
jgi:hypothetical protein